MREATDMSEIIRCFGDTPVYQDYQDVKQKAAACIETADLPEEIKEELRNAAPYVEGRGISLDIDRHEQLETVKRLLKIKYEN